MRLLITGVVALAMSIGQADRPPNASRAVGYYDDVIKRVVMIGGNGTFTSSDRDSVWSWSGVRWELITSDGPPSRANAAAAFDALSKRGVFGGGAARTPENRFRASGDSWQSNGTSWQPSTGHPERDHLSMVTDQSGAVLMFGGIPAGGAAPWPTDTWRYRDGAWARIASSGPAGRARSALAYDSKRRQVVLFGGVTASSGPNEPQEFVNDTWIWENDSWRRAADSGPRGRYAHGMVFDERAGVVLLYSGAAAHRDAPLSDMWQWDGTRWSEITLTGSTPGYRYQPVMVYDRARGKTVLYGGLNNFKNDTWEWDGTRWTEIR